MAAIAIIVADTQRSRLGLPARLDDVIAGRTVLEHTLQRVTRLKRISKIVLVHPADQDPLSFCQARQAGKRIESFPVAGGLDLPRDRHWAAARAWALTCWRGGIGTATTYDELLPAGPLVQAMQAHDAASALLVRGEWCAFDPALADEQLSQHLENPEAFKLCFTQAPPGLSALVAHRTVLEQVAEHHGGIGQALGYNARRPALDPIGREVNIAVPATVRDTFRRFSYDTPRSIALLRAIAERLGDAFATADAQTITDTCRATESDYPDWSFVRLPQQVTMELTPRREVAGPITPQHYVTFDRPDMDVELARRLFAQLGDPETAGDVALRLGGLGDALLHPHWPELVEAARDAGVLNIALDTDLLCDTDTLERVMDSPVDVLSVRLNADTAETYRQVMGDDCFETVAKNLHYVLQKRGERWERGEPRLPWLVPRLTKTADTLPDLESFFDRWMLAEGHAVVEPAQTGVGLMPAQSPMPMAPPKRRPCRQLAGRMTVLSDGRVALCDQDWQGRAALGEAQTESLLDIWQRVRTPATAHAQGRFDELTLCGACEEWHRP